EPRPGGVVVYRRSAGVVLRCWVFGSVMCTSRRLRYDSRGVRRRRGTAVNEVNFGAELFAVGFFAAGGVALGLAALGLRSRWALGLAAAFVAGAAAAGAARQPAGVCLPP